MFRSRQLQLLVGVAISVIFLVLALANERLDKVADALLNANYLALVPALLLYFAGVWIRGLRWRLLLSPLAPRISTLKTFEVIVIGYMANNVLPARIGELVRAYVLSKREGIRKTAAIATILVERIFDALVMVGFAAAVVLIVTVIERDALSTGPAHNLGTFLSQQSTLITLLSVALLVVLVAFVVIASSRSRAESAVRLVLRFLPGKLHERVERLAVSFIDGLGSLRSIGGLLSVFGLSITAWLFEAGMYYVLGTWGFNLKTPDGAALPFYVYVLATAFANLGTLVPQAPGYIGVFDAIAKGVLVSAFGVSGDNALSYVLVLHAALLVPITLLGFVYLWRESMSWGELTGLEKTRAKAARQAHEWEGPLSDIELVGEGQIIEGDAERGANGSATEDVDGSADEGTDESTGEGADETRDTPQGMVGARQRRVTGAGRENVK